MSTYFFFLRDVRTPFNCPSTTIMALQPRDEIVIAAQSTISYLSYTTKRFFGPHDSVYSTTTRTSTSLSTEYSPSLTIDLPNPTGTLYYYRHLQSTIALLTDYSTAYTTTVTAIFTPVVYAAVPATPRNVTTIPPLCPGPDKVLYAAFGLVGFGTALGLWLLGQALCYAGRKCRERKMERRRERAWQEREERRGARQARSGSRYDAPRCDAPKPPPAYVEAIEMA